LARSSGEAADTAKEREKGLMGRSSLAENMGMFFAFKDPQVMQFWMKNTLIPLEILFFDAEGNFVNVATMEPCQPMTILYFPVKY
jgi:uncharacterized membrane protein (UPF0127 family)